jgi:hypothetical protein
VKQIIVKSVEWTFGCSFAYCNVSFYI